MIIVQTGVRALDTTVAISRAVTAITDNIDIIGTTQMSPTMTLQLIGSCKSFIAILTNKWLLSRVCASMTLQCIPPCKPLNAQVTSKWLVPRMGPSVAA